MTYKEAKILYVTMIKWASMIDNDEDISIILAKLNDTHAMYMKYYIMEMELRSRL